MICATRSARFAILERGVGSARPAAVGGVEPDLADEAHEVQLAAFIFGDQHDRRAHRVASGHAGEAADGGVVEVDGEVGADQRLDARIGRFLENSNPPNRLLVSVLAIAGVSSALACLNSVSTEIAPSRGAL